MFALHRVIAAVLVTALGAGGALTTATASVAAPSNPPSTAAAVDGVHVGAGSYAPEPPAELGSKPHDMLSTPLYIDGSLAGKPIPTNAWWTDLVVSKYSGDLWADPLVLSNSEVGTKVSYPTTWNTDGTAMQLGSPVVVGGEVAPDPRSDDRVIADFEHGIPEGWEAVGDAFATTSIGTAAGQSPVSGFIGHGLVNSFTNARGDGATGSLRSTPFTIDRDHLAFLVGGGKSVDHDEEVRLVVDGTVLRTAQGSDSEAMSWRTWDVSDLRGRTASIEIVDQREAGWAHVLVDQIVATDSVTDIEHRYDTTFRAESAKALRWGDWNVSWRMQQTGGTQHVDVTAARGIPYTWFEFTDMAPVLTTVAGARVLDANGVPLGEDFTADRFIIEQDGRRFGVHLPESTSFAHDGATIRATAPVASLVLSALPADGADLDALQQHAFAIPRDTTMDYSYDPERALVQERWDIATDSLDGRQVDTIQGWLPHQYRGTQNNFDLQDFGYDSPRGRMKTTIGHGGWTTAYAFEGMTPIAPPPADPSATSTMRDYVHAYAKKTQYGGDTYWGGKDVLQLAEYMTAAKQIGAEADYAALKRSLTTALDDWFTYSKGEKEHFFARYDNWGALIGFAESYGSYQFTDNHFHYGYFTLAAALLAFEDPTWAEQYGDMATLVARQYAEWDRDSADFPYLRTFDAWEGHSYAGGYSSPGGNNQESSSEAIQSWAGLFLLGTALGNDEMQAAGAMGYTTERAAVREYYLDVHGNPHSAQADGNGVFPDAYQHSTTGILFDSGQGFATYFSADPAWIYGIQWMPTAPWLNYLGWDPAFSRSLLDDMFALRPKAIGQDGVVDGNGGRLQMAVKKWYGIGTYGDIKITEDRPAAIEEMKNAVREAELNHPGWATSTTPDNPLWDRATGEAYVSVDAAGAVVFPSEHWTPETLPSSLVPPRISDAEVDKQPKEWSQQYVLVPYLSTGYVADTERIQDLYAMRSDDTDTGHAADVISRMGDALGNVVLGFVAQADPELYARIHDELAARADPVVTSASMAGMVYYNAAANRVLGTETLERHTSSPTSQVYLDAKTHEYHYVIFNPRDTQETVTVYEGDRAIGSIEVPAHALVDHGLDARLDRITVTAPATTMTPGSSSEFTATGYDQYGATIAIPELRWSASDGASIDAHGRFSSADRHERVTVTATSGTVNGTASIRVDDAPVPTGLRVSPAFARVVNGTDGTRFSARAVDQYGDPVALADDIAWTVDDGGHVDDGGTVTATGVGSGYVTASAQGLTGSAVVSFVAPPKDVALGRTTVLASSTIAGNEARFAFDDDPTTRWESRHGSDDESLTVDLGARYDLTGVEIDWENAAASQYELLVADSENGPWRDAKVVTKDTAGTDTVAYSASGRFVRMHGLGRLTQYGYSIFDMKVFGTPGVTAIDPTELLVSPRNATVATNRTLDLTAYAFDAEGNGGEAAVEWTSAGNGSIGSDGVFVAGSSAGEAVATARLGDLGGTAAIEVRDFAGEAAPASRNIAIGKPVTVSSVESPGLAGGAAVDGSLTTRWSSAATDDQWIEVDLGRSAPIDRIELDWEAAYAKRFRLELRSSPDAPWTTAVAEDAGSGGHESYEIARNARYVRMLGIERSGGYGYSLHELAVFSTQGAPTPDLALGRPTVASSSEGEAFDASAATDGNPGTRWASRWSDDEWLQVDLGARRALHSIAIDWENAYATDYVVEARDSVDDAWKPLADVHAGDGGTDGIDVEGSGRFVRIRGEARATQFGYSIYSLTVR